VDYTRGDNTHTVNPELCIRWALNSDPYMTGLTVTPNFPPALLEEPMLVVDRFEDKTGGPPAGVRPLFVAVADSPLDLEDDRGAGDPCLTHNPRLRPPWTRAERR